MKKQACGVYLIRDNKILFLVRQKKDDTNHQQGIYLPIGGKVEPGEDIETSAIREVQEESGIRINSLDLVGITLIRGQASGEDEWINFVFTSSDFEGEPIDGNEGHFEWVDIDKIDEHNLYPGDKIYLKYLKQYTFWVVDLEYKGFEFIGYKLIKAVE